MGFCNNLDQARDVAFDQVRKPSAAGSVSLPRELTPRFPAEMHQES